jgi:anaerobic selenocysteine-containing dehydrogenase
MKSTRRSFLKWSGISALGTIVFAGCGIPEEEFLVQSSAQMPEDLVSGLEAWYATTCAQCSAGEGVIVRVIEGRAIKIEGNPDHPVSRGKTSVRCQAGLQSLYNPDRLTGPLARNSSGVLQPITWDTALTEFVRRLQGQNPASVGLITEPLNGTLGMVAGTFMDAYGGSHKALEPLENTVLRTAVKQVFGQDRLPEFDLENADYVLSFGADFLSTWLSPVHYGRAYGEFRQGRDHRGTLVQVEPRMSMTAANADRWVYANPGWEGTMALSIAYVLMTEHVNRIDTSVVDAMTGGAGAGWLEGFAPELVAGSIGVSVEAIKRIAEELVEHPRSLVIGGGSAAAHTNGLFNLKAIYSLNYLLGSVGKKGGILFNPDSPLGEVAGGAKVASCRDWETFVGAMGKGVTMVMTNGANPVYGLPASLGFKEAVDRLDSLVSFSSFMDETTAMADLVLPDHVYLESWGDDIPEPGPGYETVTFQQPVVYPFHSDNNGSGTRAFGDVLLETGRLLGGSVAQALPWATMKDVLRDSARKLHGLNRGSVQASDFEAFWNTVLQRGVWLDSEFKGPTQPGGPPTLAQSAVPEFTGTLTEYPFYMVPFSSNSLTDGRGANLPWLQASPDPITTTTWHTWAEINVNKAKELGIEEGDELEIQSQAGTIKALAYPHPGAHPDVISIPTGQGHTDYGNYEVGDDLNRSLVGKGRGANVLDVLSSVKDKETGALAWAATRVKISKTGNWVRLSKFEGTVPPMFSEEITPLSIGKDH